MNFFLEKQLKKFACTYQPLSFCKILKTFLGPIQSYEDVPFSGPKWPICPEQNFFGTNHYYYFHLPIGPFHCAKFLKTSYRGSIVKRMHHFWVQNDPFAPNKHFFGKLLISLSSTYQPLSLCKIKTKNYQRIQSYEEVQFLGPKWPICPNDNFFRKPVNEPCFFHSCLSKCQKSKSDINLLVKY